jgi:16S rRNA processing protein RimM
MSQVVIGQLGGLHGVQGALKLKSFCDPADGIFNYRPWTLVRPRSIALGPPVNVAELVSAQMVPIKLRASGDQLVVRFSDIEDREQAALWIGSQIQVPRAALPKLKLGEYYWSDLVGLEVVNTEGVSFGHIKEMMATGSNDVIVVSGERERLLPYLPGQCVLEVDVPGRRMRVDWDADF